MQRIKQRTAVQRLISFIDRQGLIPLFILLCFLCAKYINKFCSESSHIRPKYYFIVLASSKLVSTIILGYLGKEITTILTYPFKRDINVSCVGCILDCWKKVRTAFYGVEKGVTS